MRQKHTLNNVRQKTSMDSTGIVIVIMVIATVVTVISIRKRNEQRLIKVEARMERFRNLLSQSYLVEPCSRCLEDQMELIEIAPSARSIHYKCMHCGKKKHSSAGSPNAIESIQLWNKILVLAEEYNGGWMSEQYPLIVTFQTPCAPLPFEQTTRSPIREAIRSEIWRRDHGKCVECGSNQNLQFDHIIPVSLGGATSVMNLQLLCQQCNSRKGAKI